jgi:hypothetical protein
MLHNSQLTTHNCQLCHISNLGTLLPLPLSLSLSLSLSVSSLAVVSAQDLEKRLVDVSDTELEVKEVHTKPNMDTFVVTVQRTDDLLANDGTFLAERVMSVAFDFDVQNHDVGAPSFVSRLCQSIATKCSIFISVV